MGDRILIVENALRAELRVAMRARDTTATAALRSALAALDNAGAVPTDVRAGAVETSAVGVGVADTARRELSPDEERGIVQAEIDDRRAAAKALSPALGERARAEADVLERVLACL